MLHNSVIYLISSDLSSSFFLMILITVWLHERVNRGSEIDRQTTANGDTALHLAAYRGDLSICRMLLYHGAGTLITNKQGRTALEESQIKGHDEISLLIAQHNVFRERQGTSWRLPQHYVITSFFIVIILSSSSSLLSFSSLSSSSAVIRVITIAFKTSLTRSDVYKTIGHLYW